MRKFYQFYLIFTIFIAIEMIGGVIYIRKAILDIRSIGIIEYPTLIDNSIGYLFANFLTFTSLSYAVIAQNHFALIFYFYFSSTILLSFLCITPFSKRPYLQLSYLSPKLFEILFVFYNSDLYSQKILFIRNRKIGSDLKLKRVLNVSIKLI
ncbi:hypothetical protein H312_02230 [Anncaliia algerae PRA339]|uniref:Uncharacterized protein n=1 Tax=Anncaliia algerae PRA339 TaxID=1288291 RepID=A0A059EZS1_9MICR|nr:hypothetical protein H312_02230 [Anncaliia algerae PRA339]